MLNQNLTLNLSDFGHKISFLKSRLYVKLRLYCITVFKTYKQLHLDPLISQVFQVCGTPLDSQWMGWLRGGVMLKLLGVFAFWTLNFLFGIDLWTILTIQKFEPEVNSWDDIEWHRAQFIHVREIPLTQPSLFEFDLLQSAFTSNRTITL